MAIVCWNACSTCNGAVFSYWWVYPSCGRISQEILSPCEGSVEPRIALTRLREARSYTEGEPPITAGDIELPEMRMSPNVDPNDVDIIWYESARARRGLAGCK